MSTLYINSDGDVELGSLKDTVSGEYQNDATVTAQLYNSSGTAVGSSFPLDYVADSLGNYRGRLPATTTAGLTRGGTYEIRAVAVSAAGSQREFATQKYPAGYGNEA